MAVHLDEVCYSGLCGAAIGATAGLVFWNPAVAVVSGAFVGVASAVEKLLSQTGPLKSGGSGGEKVFKDVCRIGISLTAGAVVVAAIGASLSLHGVVVVTVATLGIAALAHLAGRASGVASLQHAVRYVPGNSVMG